MIGMRGTEIASYNVGKVVCSVVRTVLRAPTIADDNRFTLSICVVADFLESISQIRTFQSIDTSQIEVGARSHTTISGIGMVVGYCDCVAFDNDT